MWWDVTTGLSNGLASNRRLAIVQTNVTQFCDAYIEGDELPVGSVSISVLVKGRGNGYVENDVCIHLWIYMYWASRRTPINGNITPVFRAYVNSTTHLHIEAFYLGSTAYDLLKKERQFLLIFPI